jgi:hypothetical protein
MEKLRSHYRIKVNDYVLVIAEAAEFESAFPSLVLCLAMGS